jgi:hypothetical protein
LPVTASAPIDTPWKKQHGQTGGLFVNQAAALKFALFENGNRKGAVVNVPGVFELDLGGVALAA